MYFVAGVILGSIIAKFGASFSAGLIFGALAMLAGVVFMETRY